MGGAGLTGPLRTRAAHEIPWGRGCSLHLPHRQVRSASSALRRRRNSCHTSRGVTVMWAPWLGREVFPVQVFLGYLTHFLIRLTDKVFIRCVTLSAHFSHWTGLNVLRAELGSCPRLPCSINIKHNQFRNIIAQTHGLTAEASSPPSQTHGDIFSPSSLCNFVHAVTGRGCDSTGLGFPTEWFPKRISIHSRDGRTHGQSQAVVDTFQGSAWQLSWGSVLRVSRAGTASVSLCVSITGT